VDYPVGLFGGLGPVHLHTVGGQLGFQLFKQVRQPGQGPGLDVVAQLPQAFALFLVREGIGALLHQRIHGDAEVGAQLIVGQGAHCATTEAVGEFFDRYTLAHGFTSPLTRSQRKLARCRPRNVCCCFSREPLMLSRQPPSAVTISAAPDSRSERVLSSTMAPETSGMRTEKVPPKPQHSLSWS